MGDTKTLFQTHVERVGGDAEDYLMDRKTGVDCDYAKHPDGAPFHAVLIYRVDVSSCCRDDDNSEVRACWYCITRGGPYDDEHQCKCGGENSVHESKELTFSGEIQLSEAAEKAAAQS